MEMLQMRDEAVAAASAAANGPAKVSFIYLFVMSNRNEIEQCLKIKSNASTMIFMNEIFYLRQQTMLQKRLTSFGPPNLFQKLMNRL